MPCLYPKAIALITMLSSALLGFGILARIKVTNNTDERVPQYLAPKWDIGSVDSVHMMIQESHHYSVENSNLTFLIEDEYASLLPPGGHLVYLDPEGGRGPWRPYTVAMFHQLRCLQILARSYMRGTASAHTQHCLNYLRQSVLCLADTRLESVRSPMKSPVTTIERDYVCRDWTSLYKAQEQNRKVVVREGSWIGW